jgi:hypothetical protein
MSDNPEKESSNEANIQNWPRLMRTASSPLKVFALVVLICTTIFASAAAVLGDPISFMYCIHMFLGLVGMFSAIAVWCPASLYHPKELKNIPAALLPANNRIGPTVAVVIIVLIYAFYQFATPKKVVLIPKDYSVYNVTDGKLVTN